MTATKILVTSVTKDSPGAGQVTIVGTYTAATSYTQPHQQVSVGNYPTGNANWSRFLRLTNDALFIMRNGATSVAFDAASLAQIGYTLETTLTYVPKINTQPAAASCVHASTAATFNVTNASSELTATYQWQYSLDGSTAWTDCSGTVSGCAYTNGTTATLTCTPTTVAHSGTYHRCTITNSLGATTTSSAVLTIT